MIYSIYREKNVSRNVEDNISQIVLVAIVSNTHFAICSVQNYKLSKVHIMCVINT